MKFESLSRLGSFSAIKKTVEGGRGVSSLLFLSLFLTIHINFQYKLTYIYIRGQSPTTLFKKKKTLAQVLSCQF